MALSPDGRMLRRDISNSHGFASLSPEAAVLFCMLIPHLNAHGKTNGGTGFVKDEICPLVQYLTHDNIPILLQEISAKTNVKHFQHGGRWWLHSLNFLTHHQKIREDRLGEDRLPSYEEPVAEISQTTPGVIQENSGPTPGLLPPEGEGEEKEEVEGEGEGEGEGQVEEEGIRTLFTGTSPTFDGDPTLLVHSTVCPVEKIVALYHDILPELPRVRELTAPLKKSIRQRWKEKQERQNLEWWTNFFRGVGGSDFLMGRVKDFVASLNWLMGPTNFSKVLSGQYDNRGGEVHGTGSVRSGSSATTATRKTGLPCNGPDTDFLRGI